MYYQVLGTIQADYKDWHQDLLELLLSDLDEKEYEVYRFHYAHGYLSK